MDNFDDEVEAFRAALQRAYASGLQDGAERAKRQILAAINVTPNEHSAQSRGASAPTANDVDDADSRKRAPRGLPRALTLRVLRDSPNGATPQQIIDAANTEFEKMIAVSSIRSELRRGEEEGRYVEVGGVWHLANSDEAGGHTDQDTPPASNSSHERTEDASSVTSNVMD